MFCLISASKSYSQSDSVVVCVLNKLTSEPVMGISVIPSYGNNTIVLNAPGIFVVDKYYKTKQLNIIKEGYSTGYCLLYNPELLEDSMTIYLVPVLKNSNPVFLNSMQTKINQLKEQYSMSDKNIGKCASDTTQIVHFPEIEAEFPGGSAALKRFMANQIDYPEEALENEEMGRVYMSYIVDVNGEISNIKVERGVSASLDAESTRIIQAMPKWIPAICDGVFVKSRQRLPITYTCCH